MPLTKACPCVIVVPVGAALEGAVVAHTLSSFPLWFTHITIVETDALGSMAQPDRNGDIDQGGGGDFAERFPDETVQFWNRAGLLPVALTSSPGRDGPTNNASLVASTVDRTNALHLAIQDRLKRPQNLKLIVNANSAVSGDSIASSLAVGGRADSLSGVELEDSLAASLRLGSRAPSTNLTTRTNTFVDELEGGTSRRLEGAAEEEEEEEDVDQHQRMEIDMEHASISFGVSGYTQKFQYLFFVGDSSVAARFSKTFPTKVFHLAPDPQISADDSTAESPSRNEAVINHSPSKVTLRHGRVEGAGTPTVQDDDDDTSIPVAQSRRTTTTPRASRSNLSSMRLFPVKTCSKILERFSVDGKPSKASDFLEVLAESIEDVNEELRQQWRDEHEVEQEGREGVPSPSPNRLHSERREQRGGLLDWPAAVAVGVGIVIFAVIIRKLI